MGPIFLEAGTLPEDNRVIKIHRHLGFFVQGFWKTHLGWINGIGTVYLPYHEWLDFLLVEYRYHDTRH